MWKQQIAYNKGTHDWSDFDCIMHATPSLPIAYQAPAAECKSTEALLLFVEQQLSPTLPHGDRAEFNRLKIGSMTVPQYRLKLEGLGRRIGASSDDIKDRFIEGVREEHPIAHSVLLGYPEKTELGELVLVAQRLVEDARLNRAAEPRRLVAAAMPHGQGYYPPASPHQWVGAPDFENEEDHYPEGSGGFIPPSPRGPSVQSHDEFIRAVAAQVGEQLATPAAQPRPPPPPYAQQRAGPQAQWNPPQGGSGYTSYGSMPAPHQAQTPYMNARGGGAAGGAAPYQLRAPLSNTSAAATQGRGPSDRVEERFWIELEKLPAQLWAGPSPARNENDLGRKWHVRDCPHCTRQGRPEVDPVTGLSNGHNPRFCRHLAKHIQESHPHLRQHLIPATDREAVNRARDQVYGRPPK